MSPRPRKTYAPPPPDEAPEVLAELSKELAELVEPENPLVPEVPKYGPEHIPPQPAPEEKPTPEMIPYRLELYYRALKELGLSDEEVASWNVRDMNNTPVSSPNEGILPHTVIVVTVVGKKAKVSMA